ncbi:hypothetical protein [Spirosoma sp. KNUC1025]|nr:hypothetical protein LN737_24210 [Spirosoma sp. KNUC1025]
MILLTLIGTVTVLYIKIKRLGNIESDSLRDDSDTSDGDDWNGGDDD